MRNYHWFLRLSTHAFKTDVPKINIKVLEWAFPAVQKKKEADTDGQHVAKRNVFNSSEFCTKYSYRSPLGQLNSKLIKSKRKLCQKKRKSRFYLINMTVKCVNITQTFIRIAQNASCQWTLKKKQVNTILY